MNLFKALTCLFVANPGTAYSFFHETSRLNLIGILSGRQASLVTFQGKFHNSFFGIPPVRPDPFLSTKFKA